MKRILVLLFFIPLLFPCKSYGALKEIVYNWATNTLTWETKTNIIPCEETFTIKIANCPEHTQKVTIWFYDSNGGHHGQVITINQAAPAPFPLAYTAASTTTSTEFIATIPAKNFHHYYFLKVELTTQNSTSVTANPNVSVNRTNGTPNPNGNVTTQTNTIVTTTTHPASSSTTTATTTIETATEVITTEIKSLVDPVYGVPLKTELSYVEVLGAIGGISFPKSGIWTGANWSAGFVSGLKIHLAPVSLNPDIDRYGLYPKLSKWSFTVGALITNVKYQDSPINGAFAGLRPAFGVDYEILHGALGLTAGTILGQQDVNPKLNTETRLVTGFYFGLSFSADIFSKFKANVPATGLTP